MHPRVRTVAISSLFKQQTSCSGAWVRFPSAPGEDDPARGVDRRRGSVKPGWYGGAQNQSVILATKIWRFVFAGLIPAVRGFFFDLEYLFMVPLATKY